MNSGITGNTGDLIRKLTVLLIFCFFLNCLYLARDRGVTKNSQKDLVSSLEGKEMAKLNKEVDINIPVLN